MWGSFKRILLHVMACLCVVAVTFSCFPAGSVLAAGTAKTTDYLNLREGPSITSKVLKVLWKGVSVTVLDNSNSQWTKVQTQSGKQGWCFKTYLSGLPATTSPNSSSSPNTSPSSGGTAKTTDYLNLREGPSITSKVLKVLWKGVSVTVLDNSNSQWAKVQTQSGKQGWCSKTYLSGLSSSSSKPSSSSSGTAPNTTAGQTAKTTDYLNLRNGASLNSKVLAILGKGTSVTVLDNSNSQWVKVRTQSKKEGWCSRQYLIITGNPISSSSKESSSKTVSFNSSSSPSSVPSSSSMPSSSSSSPDSSNNGDTSGTRTITGATVTASVLRLRTQAGTNSSILANLPYGTNLTVLDTSVSGWVKVKTPDGKTGYVSANYIKLHYSDDPAEGTSNDSSALSLSSYSQSIPAGKTFYLKATANSSYSTVNWSSNNESVAKVTNGYVLAVGKGSAVITASSGSYSATCNISVTDAEPVRTAYASPNTASPGQTVTLTAVTDISRDGVTFKITRPDGGTSTVTAGNSTEETTNGVTTKKWTATTTLQTAGSYTILAVSSQNGYYSTTGYTTSAFISTQDDFSVSTNEDRRASDKMIQLIAKWEGYRSSVYTDTISSSQVPTVGYGCTVATNEVFYNNLSQTEAWSLMVNKMNSSSYTSELNKMIQKNKFKMNQNQADALISFAYNVGAGYFNSSNEMDFITIMKNAVVPPSFSAGSSHEATITKDTEIRDQSGSLSQITGNVSAGTDVFVTGGDFVDTRDGWYHIQTNDGETGWVNSGYVQFKDTTNLVHDLNYTNAYAFGSELIRWNQAGGKFYTGLFYRRLGEANAYNYGDYSAIRYNKYNYHYPSAASSLN